MKMPRLSEERAPSRELIWCLDSPGFGGSEIDFARILEMLGRSGDPVIRNRNTGPELRAIYRHYGLREQPIAIDNSLRGSARGLSQAGCCLRKFPRGRFVIWAHHSDSHRWLQLALALRRRPFIIVERIVPAARHDFGTSRLSIPLKRFIAARAHCVILNGHSQVGHYRLVFGLQNARIKVIPTSRPVPQLRAQVRDLRDDKARLLASLNLPQNVMSHPIALCVARLTAQKDQATLLRAVAQMPPESRPYPVLVGDGPDLEELRQLAQELLAGQCYFAGHQADPTPWLAAADCFILPSLSEGLPGALIEALAAELPCIATDIPGNRELVQHEKTGLSIPPQDPNALAQALRNLLSQPQRATQMARRGYELVAAEYDAAGEKRAWSTVLSEWRGN